uniref:Reverse transcriptase RNase H-like domain-containing protein n=1 Tax=Salarias fasciatus TaxID=181472 RepID=A0A672G681_SALFA
MATYCARFIKDFASISAPLRELTKKGTPWHWSSVHAKALQDMKDSLTSDTVMSYFDPEKHTELVVDASPVGLGAILYQLNKEGERRTIAYASRALSDVEKRYSQTEREALAIVWSCEHFHLYLFGHSFTLVTDHKALEVIWNNPRSKPPARIERWGLRLQPYDFAVVYRKGAENPADYMSRHPASTQHGLHTRATKVAEDYVNFMAQQATPKAMTLSEIQEETLKDPLLKKVSEHARHNTWHTIKKDSQDATALQKYKQISGELTVSPTDDIILRGLKIVIPSALEDKVLQLAH